MPRQRPSSVAGRGPRWAPMLDQMEAELARHGGPWFGGASYSALDPLAFMLCR